jgi:hypothetical protein
VSGWREINYLWFFEAKPAIEVSELSDDDVGTRGELPLRGFGHVDDSLVEDERGSSVEVRQAHSFPLFLCRTSRSPNKFYDDVAGLLFRPACEVSLVRAQ